MGKQALGNGKWETGTGNRNRGNTQGGRPEDTGAATGANTETGAGCQDIEQAAVCWLATARQGSDTWAWIVWYIAEPNAGRPEKETEAARGTERKLGVLANKLKKNGMEKMIEKKYNLNTTLDKEFLEKF